MVKANDVVVFNEENPEKFTEFEYLKARVEQIEKVIEGHTDIFRENNLNVTEVKTAEYFDEDEVFEALAGN